MEIIDRLDKLEGEMSDVKTGMALITTKIENIPSQTKLMILEALKEDRELVKEELVATVKAVITAAPAPAAASEKESPMHQNISTPVWLAIIGVVSAIFTGFFKLLEMLINHPAAAQVADKITKGS